ncbi:two-component system sensor histidine kinase NtrB [Gemmatimonas sp.]
MVRQLLTFARGADGERRSLEVSAAVREVERIIHSTFPKNISLSVNLANGLPRILGDATQLHQVLVNLAVNARDAMSKGGLLSITVEDTAVNAEMASHVTVAAARPGHFLRMSVRDSGDGIADELLDRISDPFYTTKGPERGTGLGLSTVLGIVKGHDGFVQVESRPGEGSTFHVYLPVAGEDAPPMPAVEASRGVNTTGTVLFVDDEPFIRSMIAILARRIGCDATTVGSTDEALALLNR